MFMRVAERFATLRLLAHRLHIYTNEDLEVSA